MLPCEGEDPTPASDTVKQIVCGKKKKELFQTKLFQKKEFRAISFQRVSRNVSIRANDYLLQADSQTKSSTPFDAFREFLSTLLCPRLRFFCLTSLSKHPESLPK
jgi:hypothetical protein